MGTLRYDGVDYPVADADLVGLQLATWPAFSAGQAFCIEMRSADRTVWLFMSPGVPVTFTADTPEAMHTGGPEVDLWGEQASKGLVLDLWVD